ncbi:transcriptional regulator [Bradyrhizobium sp. SSBR45G]|uniref:AraC-like ligand-binding domain-containing protein n=1 Tax=unclassified Bradyrhizobium TaxID=2631580 RepID=UPI002342BD0A|nr:MULTISPECIES: helix-turn-helix domain-containing protein [unclassified Bradyrhizobium]GLH77117.1 transcriptional regulator [Bradyrhizobium sp. SSBR45G]GLH83875.1 transcriptional regulator [Bradyrhizobium sp. SSBR45R]
MQPKQECRAPEVIHATTAGLCERDRFDYWHGVVCKAIVDLDPQPVGRVRFDASLNSVITDRLAISRIRASAHRVARLPAAIARSGDETLIFNFVVRGEALVEQDGRTVHLRAGDGAVCDAERPYGIRFEEPFDVASIRIPRSTFAQSATRIHRVTALSLAKISQLCPMLFAYAVSFSETASLLGASSSEKVFQNFSDLLRAALDEAVLGVPLPLSEYRAAALLRVKDYVERHADDHQLDASQVAIALNLSSRYINKLLEAEGLSLSRYIWRRRIERAATSLGDPHLKGETVSDIAMRHGFNDLSHFSHAFRDRFGISARDYRARAKGSR